MIRLYTSLLILNTFTLLSQNFKRDLFITFEDSQCKPCLKLINKDESENLQSESYTLNFDQNSHLDYTLSVDENGFLVKQISSTGSLGGDHTIEIVYKNVKNDNVSINVRMEDIYNRIDCKELLYSKDTPNIMSLLAKFENIYLIKIEDKTINHYIAKKVKVKQRQRL